MNLDSKTIGDVTRSLLGFLGGIAVSKGWMDSATMVTLTGALATIVVAVWPMFFGGPKSDPA